MVNEVTWSNYEDVRRFLVGKKVKLVNYIEQDTHIEGIYINVTMERNSGKIMTISNLELHGATPVVYLKEDRSDYMYPLSLVEEFYKEKEETEEQDISEYVTYYSVNNSITYTYVDEFI